MALLKIVEGDDLMAAREKDFGADTADVASSAGDQNIQGEDLSFAREMNRWIGTVNKLSGCGQVVSGEIAKDYGVVGRP